jgi:hypothetical protein
LDDCTPPAPTRSFALWTARYLAGYSWQSCHGSVIVVLHNESTVRAPLPLMYHGHVLVSRAQIGLRNAALFSAAADRSHVLRLPNICARYVPWLCLDFVLFYPDLAQHFIDAMRGSGIIADDRMVLHIVAVVNGRSWQDYRSANPRPIKKCAHRLAQSL